MPQRKRPCPVSKSLDRLFRTKFRRLWSRWSDVLVIVKPETAIHWRRAGFRLYWRWRSRRRGGPPKVTDEIRGLIRRLAEENPDWGAPKLDGELLRLGFVVSERTVARYLRGIRRRGDPSKRWLAFLQDRWERTGSSNHCARPFRKLAHTVTRSWTAVRNSTPPRLRF
ncbi:MAG: helix-turn-helix domain-containing protein [Bryobacteraceae bacterium]